MKQNKGDTIAFRAIGGHKELLERICNKNDVTLSNLMAYMVAHYIKKNEIINFVIEIKK